MLALAGCSALRLGYNQGAQLAYWWLDGRLDFDPEQSPSVKAALAEWFVWHRQTQLPGYAALLARAQDDVAAPATAALACQWADRLRAELQPAIDRALPQVARIALTLTPRQIEHLAGRFAESNEKLRRELLQPDPELRRSASIDRAVERFETFYGPLDDRQRRVVADRVAASPFDADAWMAERAQRQRDTIATLRVIVERRPDVVQAQALLRALLQRVDGTTPRNGAGTARGLEQYNCAFAAQVHNTITPVQQAHARDKLKGWEGDMRQLAAEASAAPARTGSSTAPGPAGARLAALRR